jgi:hypothetical protein
LANRYDNIAERNVFGLRPAPSEPGPVAEPASVPKILLTGITTILGDKRALLKAQVPAARPGGQPREQSLVLSEGQRDGLIEVLQIDQNRGSVKVNDFGTILTLTFENDGVKTPNPPAAVPLHASRAGESNPLLRAGGQNMRVLPSRGPRSPTAGGTVLPAPLPAAGTPLPTSGPSQSQAGSQPSQLSPEEELLLMELEQGQNPGRDQTLGNPYPLKAQPGTF